MNEYNAYITAVNKIFDYISKMRTGWSSKDNISYIDSIEEYKQLVVNTLNTFKTSPPNPTDQQNVNTNTNVEGLSND